MCDERTLRDAEDRLRRSFHLTRREFGALSVGTGLTMLLPRAGMALEVSASDVEVSTPDGTADCHLAHPVSGAHPGVLVWPDALGLRPAFKEMGRRLADLADKVVGRLNAAQQDDRRWCPGRLGCRSPCRFPSVRRPGPDASTSTASSATERTVHWEHECPGHEIRSPRDRARCCETPKAATVW